MKKLTNIPNFSGILLSNLNNLSRSKENPLSKRAERFCLNTYIYTHVVLSLTLTVLGLSSPTSKLSPTMASDDSFLANKPSLFPMNSLEMIGSGNTQPRIVVPDIRTEQVPNELPRQEEISANGQQPQMIYSKSHPDTHPQDKPGSMLNELSKPKRPNLQHWPRKDTIELSTTTSSSIEEANFIVNEFFLNSAMATNLDDKIESDV